MEQQHSPEYRTVAVFGSVADAEIARGLLESDGIAAALLDTLDATLMPGAGSTVRLLVPSDDLVRARDLLTQPSPFRDEDDERAAGAPVAAKRSWLVAWLGFLLAVAAALAAYALNAP